MLVIKFLLTFWSKVIYCNLYISLHYSRQAFSTQQMPSTYLWACSLPLRLRQFRRLHCQRLHFWHLELRLLLQKFRLRWLHQRFRSSFDCLHRARKPVHCLLFKRGHRPGRLLVGCGWSAQVRVRCPHRQLAVGLSVYVGFWELPILQFLVTWIEVESSKRLKFLR